jgi:HEAT repeat protein
VLEFASLRVRRLRASRDVAGLVETLDSGGARDRRAAANALITIPDPRAVDSLIRALRSPDPLLRVNAALALGELQGPRPEYAGIREPLVEALQDESPPVRAMAASALGRRKDADSVPALARLLDDGDALVRKTTAAVLRDFDDPRADEALRTHTS